MKRDMIDEVLADHVHAGVCVVREGRFLYVNFRLAEMLGLVREHMLAEVGALDIVSPEDREKLAALLSPRHAWGGPCSADVRLMRGNEIMSVHVFAYDVHFQGVTADLLTLIDLRAPEKPGVAPGQVSLSASPAAARRRTLEMALEGAVARREFQLLYQPQLELKQGRIHAAEALLRWRSEALGSISPAEFIPVAEQSGHIVEIGEWVLRTACEQIVAWREEGVEPVRIHVNVSAAQLACEDLARRFQMILLETGADPNLLGVEVTESLFAVDTTLAARTLNSFRALGIEIALDDFGTGYSNLSTMRALPIDLIKIDRSYVNDVTAAPEEVSMTRAVITMAHSLQMKVLAEGVETESQLMLLLAHQCDAMQGFYFSAPVEPGVFAGMLREGRRLDERFFARAPRQRTLLLVDDEENIIASLRRCLRRGGYRILTAGSAVEGLQRLAETDIDVIVSDQRMPGMTGVEFLRRAKVLYPETIRMVLSGYTELKSITDAINEGAIYKFLTKPWEDDLLRANIEEAFRQKEMADENRRLDLEVRKVNAELADANRRLQASLVSQQEVLSVVQDYGHAALDLVHSAPVALVGLDTEGLVAFANSEARLLLPELESLVGSYVGDSLPESLRGLSEVGDGVTVDAVVGGRLCRCRWSSIDANGERRGRMVAITPYRDVALPYGLES